jgi:hypothetical protein
VRFRFALLQITYERPDPEKPELAPTIEASGGHNFERSGPAPIGFAQSDPEDKHGD